MGKMCTEVGDEKEVSVDGVRRDWRGVHWGLQRGASARATRDQKPLPGGRGEYRSPALRSEAK